MGVNATFSTCRCDVNSLPVPYRTCRCDVNSLPVRVPYRTCRCDVNSLPVPYRLTLDIVPFGIEASPYTHPQLSRGGAPEWWQSGAWDPKLLIARGYVQLRSTLQSSGSGSSSSSQGAHGCARAWRVRGCQNADFHCYGVSDTVMCRRYW